MKITSSVRSLLVVGVFAAIVLSSAVAGSMYQSDIYQYVPLQGPPTCQWQKQEHLYCSSCSWYSSCSCTPGDTNNNQTINLGQGYTGPQSSTTTLTATVCGSSSTDASGKVPAGAFNIQAAVQSGYQWCITYSYNTTTYTGCSQPSF